MDQIKSGGKAGKSIAVIFSSLFASLLLGSMTALAATGPNLNVTVIPIANKGLPVMAGGAVTYIYQIWNTGDTPVSNITITDNKCSPIYYDGVGQDLNADHKLDKGELWSFWCTFTATTTTTNIVTIGGQANGAPISTSKATTVIVPPGVSGANGTAGAGSSSGTTGTLRGMPNTGLGGAAHKKTAALRSQHTTASQKTSKSKNTLNIPSLGTKAKIEAVGLTATGNMNAPVNAKKVGWYKFGPRPGQIGNAVIDGHLDTYTTSSGVFKNLNQLKTGDDVYVATAQNQMLHFKVNHAETYNAADAPLQTIFGSSDKAHLNLITCTGAWDPKSHQYTQRLVVYTDLAQ